MKTLKKTPKTKGKVHSNDKQFTVKRVPVKAFEQIQMVFYSIFLYCPALWFLESQVNRWFIIICKYQSEKPLGVSRKKRRKRKSRMRGTQLRPEYRPTQTTAEGQTDTNTKRDRQTDRWKV